MSLWRYKALPSEEELRRLLPFAQQDPLLATLLWQRGLRTEEETYAYLHADLNALHNPFLMQDMKKATQRLAQALGKGEHVLLYGDYDVDGITSVALLYLFLSSYVQDKGCLHTYLPSRHDEGYGFSSQGVAYAQEKNCGLVICLDCGTQDKDAVEEARRIGIDVIVCDHHAPHPPLAKPYALLNPLREDDSYPYKSLSGAGVGFKLLQALVEKEGLAKETLYAYLDLVALSICADLVPMTGENRVLTRWGLERWNTHPRPSLQQMGHMAGLNGSITVADIGFKISPRLNAAGRISHPKEALLCLISTEPKDIARRVAQLEALNTERRALDQQTTVEALEKIDPTKPVQVLFDPNWHKGVLGIVAARCIERHHAPTFVLTQNKQGYLTGSARSVEGINVHELLVKCKDLLLEFGGHAFAAGLGLKKENLSPLKEQLWHLLEKETKEEDEPIALAQEIDMALSLSEINENLMRTLHLMAPFGYGNMEPVFSSTHVESCQPVRWFKASTRNS